MEELPWSAAANELERTENLGKSCFTYVLKISGCMSKDMVSIGSVSVRALALSQWISLVSDNSQI